VDESTKEQVRQRANFHCEYCQMPQELDELSFQVEHIIPRKHHGTDSLDNLALACFACNNHKGANLSGIDPETREITRLFDPRRDSWFAHFRWNGAELAGRTAIGRVTIDVLRINLDYRIDLRSALIEEGIFPQAVI
jgi:hypothetical protein